MKTNVLLVAGLLLASVAFGQYKVGNEVEVKAPQFKTDIYNSIEEFLGTSVEYPPELKSRGIQGTEVIRFYVTPEGNLSSFKVINSISSEIDNNVIEALKITDGKWNPGTVANVSTVMEKEVSVAFFIHSEKEMIKTAKKYQQKANEWMFDKSNPEKALKFYDRGIQLLPNEESLLAARSLCRMQLGDNEGAQSDWDRLTVLAKRNGNEAEEFLANNDLKDYSDKMNSTIMKNGTK